MLESLVHFFAFLMFLCKQGFDEAVRGMQVGETIELEVTTWK